MWIGFWSTGAGCVGSVGLGILTFCLYYYMKCFIVSMALGAGVAVVWFSLMCSNLIYSTSDLVYAAAVLAGFFIQSTIPIFYEVTVEACYPVAEGTTTMMLTISNNLGCLIFLLLPLLPGLGCSTTDVNCTNTRWMNWGVAGACAIAFLLVIPLQITYRRMEEDMADGNQSDRLGEQTQRSVC